MELSRDLLKSFASITNSTNNGSNDVTYTKGTMVVNSDGKFVKLDGTEELTPVSIAVDADDGNRVNVMIKNHSITVTGNSSSPPKTEQYIVTKLITAENIVAGVLEADSATIDTLQSKLVTSDKVVTGILDADSATIDTLSSKIVSSDVIISNILNADEANIKSIQSKIVTSDKVVAGILEADEGNIDILQSKIITADSIGAVMGDFGYLTADVADLKNAFVGCGLITDATITEGHITGYLDSVLINADKIKAGTLSVDRLVLNGTNESIVYALNNSGELSSTHCDTLDGGLITERTITADHIVSETITANEINMSNLVGNEAFINAITTNKLVVTAAQNAADALTTSEGALTTVGDTVKSITWHYLATTANSGVTRSTSGWTDTPQSVTSTKKYLWTYQTVTKIYAANSYNTDPVITGVYGNDGEDGQNGSAGRGVKSTTITYQAGTSGTSAPTGTWGTSIPAVSASQYLWTKIVISYTDDTSSTAYSVGKMGDKGSTGATGSTGKGVKSIDPQYYLSTSSSSLAGGSWGSTPNWTSGKYLWERSHVTYTDNSTADTTAVLSTALNLANDNATSAKTTATTANTNSTNALNNTNRGLKKWLLIQYSTTSNYYTIQDLVKAKLNALCTYEYSDTSLNITQMGQNVVDNYSAYAKTYVLFTADVNLSTTITTDDAGALYLNGSLITTTVSCANTSVTMPFKKGWNVIEVTYHEGSGGDGFKFGTTISSHANCSRMDCYASSYIGLTAYEKENSVASIYTTNTTTIDGGKITTGSITANKIAANTITADKINVADLFSKTITADKMTITGGKIALDDKAYTDALITVWNSNYGYFVGSEIKSGTIYTAKFKTYTRDFNNAYSYAKIDSDKITLFNTQSSIGKLVLSSDGLSLYGSDGTTQLGGFTTSSNAVRVFGKWWGNGTITANNTGLVDGGTVYDYIRNNYMNIIHVSVGITVPANGMVNVAACSLSSITPSGFTFMGCMIKEAGYGDQWLVSASKYGDAIQLVVHSKYPVSLTNTITVAVMFIKL